MPSRTQLRPPSDITSFQPLSRTLMGPGPSDVHPRILQALSRPTLGHLDPDFIRCMDEIKALLQYAFQTESALTLPVSGPGTAGMETCVDNLLEPGDTAVVCVNGVFGGRIKATAGQLFVQRGRSLFKNLAHAFPHIVYAP